MNCNVIKLGGGRFRVETNEKDVEDLNGEILYQKGHNRHVEARKLLTKLRKL